MKDYVFKYIFSDAITDEDIKNGTTGFRYWDNLTQRERDIAIKAYRLLHKITPREELTKTIGEVQHLIRNRKREHNNNLMNVANVDVWREIVNSKVTPEDELQFRLLLHEIANEIEK